MHIRVILIKNMNSGILQVVYYPVEGMLLTWNVEDEVSLFFPMLFWSMFSHGN